MIGAKSVPALPKKYSTPRAARSSRYASAVLSTLARLVVIVVSPSGFEPQPEQPARVAFVDLRLLFLGGQHAGHRLDRIADESRSLLGVEGHVGAEEDVVGAEEGQAGFH